MFHPYGTLSPPLLDQSNHIRLLLHTKGIHIINNIHYFNHYYFYKLGYFNVFLFIYLIYLIYCSRSILLCAPTRGGHTYEGWSHLQGVDTPTRGGHTYEGWTHLRGVATPTRGGHTYDKS